MGASAQVLRHATGFLIIGSRQTIPASGNLEFDVGGWSTHGPVGPAGPREDSPAAATIGTPVCRGSHVSHQASDEEKPLLTPPSQTARLGGDVPEEGIRVAIVVATQMIATPQ